VALIRSRSHQIFAVWTENGGIEGLTPKSANPTRVAAEGGFATLVALEDGGVLAAWETPRSIETVRLDR